jgi:hypothetical protein
MSLERNSQPLSSTLSEESQSVTMSFAFTSLPHAAAAPILLRERRACIGAATVELCRKHFRSALHAIVLTGSMARDEASFLDSAAGVTSVLGDAEFLLIFKPDVPLPARKDLLPLQGEIETSLRRRKLSCTIGLSAAHPSYLQALRPHIYAYELRTCGRVLWGSSRVLSLIPEFAPADIPLEDGWRLLTNRMIEHLAAADGGFDRCQLLSPEALYGSAKLALDMATSFLLFCGLYAPTYQQRCERLRTLAKAGAAKFNPPFPLRDFAELVEWATHCKLHPESKRTYADHQVCSIVSFAAALWHWELLLLTGVNASARPDARILMRRWMRKQPIRDRIQGWASLMRRSGWKRTVPCWPRWARLAWQASPRYWIYAAAGDLATNFADADGLQSPQPAIRAHIASCLPLRRQTQSTKRPEWRALASDILWNYNEFLKETRS